MVIQYQVQAGDTVDAIAKRFGVNRGDVAGFRSGDPNTILPGETLDVAEPLVATTAVSTPQTLGGQKQPSLATPSMTNLQAPLLSDPANKRVDFSKVSFGTVKNPTAPQTTGPVSAPSPAASTGASATGTASATQTFTTPSGATVDAQGNLIEGPEQKFFGQFGVDTSKLQQGFSQNPFGTISSLVQQVMQATQLPDVRDSITSMSKEIEDLANQRDSEIEAINDNPWTSAGSKAELVRKIEDRYEKKIANRTNRLTLMQTAYENARKQAEFAATTALRLYGDERSIQADAIQKALDREERQLEAERKLNEPLSVSEAKALGVPFGTTAKQAYGLYAQTDLSSGGGSVPYGSGDVNLGLLASNIRALVGTTKPNAAAFDAGLKNARAAGPEAERSYLMAQFIDKVLTGKEKTDYYNLYEGSNAYAEAIDFLEKNPDMNMGFYKATSEGLKPKLGMPQDPRYAVLLALINRAETPIRLATAGTALTPLEKETSERSLFSKESDVRVVLAKMQANRILYENALARKLQIGAGVTAEVAGVKSPTQVTEELMNMNISTLPTPGTGSGFWDSVISFFI